MSQVYLHLQEDLVIKEMLDSLEDLAHQALLVYQEHLVLREHRVYQGL